MIKLLNSRDSQEGFTLVEIMIVVAIIGLLSAVAIPNFKTYQAKSKVSEARLQLAALYTAEQTFFSDFNMYHGCLNSMNYNPALERANRYFTIGFSQASIAVDTTMHQAALVSGLSNADCPETVASADDVSYFSAGKGVGSAVSDFAHLPLSTVGSQLGVANMVFTASAAGVIHGSFQTDLNSAALTITHDKNLVVVRTGY